MKLIIINGPNLNLLGVREKKIYGNKSFESLFDELQKKYNDISLEQYQSNHEGEIIEKIQEVGFSYDGIIINAGGFTHTSIAIRDAISSVTTPCLEVHISNILSREEFRQKSLISNLAKGTYIFTPAAGQLEVDTITPIIRQVQGLVVINNGQRSDTLYGDIELAAGSNVRLDVTQGDSDTNANGTKFGCFAFGGDMFSIA